MIETCVGVGGGGSYGLTGERGRGGELWGCIGAMATRQPEVVWTVHRLWGRGGDWRQNDRGCGERFFGDLISMRLEARLSGWCTAVLGEVAGVWGGGGWGVEMRGCTGGLWLGDT